MHQTALVLLSLTLTAAIPGAARAHGHGGGFVRDGFGTPSLLTGRSAPIGAPSSLGSFAPFSIDRAQADETERARESSLDSEIDAATGAADRTQDDSAAQPAPAGGDPLQPL